MVFQQIRLIVSVLLAAFGAPVAAQSTWSLDILTAGQGFQLEEDPETLRGMRLLLGPQTAWRFGMEIGQEAVPPGTGDLTATVVTANADRSVDLSPRWSAHAGLGLGFATRQADIGTQTETHATHPATRAYLETRFALSSGISAYAAYHGVVAMGTHRAEEEAVAKDVGMQLLNVGIGFSF